MTDGDDPHPDTAPEHPSEPAADPGTRGSAVGMMEFFTMGMSIAASLVVGGGLGLGADAIWHTSPALTFVGLGFGLVSAVLLTVANVRRYLKD